MIGGVDHLLPFLLLRRQRRDVHVRWGKQWIGSRSLGICGPGILRFQCFVDLAKLIPGFSVLRVGLYRFLEIMLRAVEMSVDSLRASLVVVLLRVFRGRCRRGAYGEPCRLLIKMQ